MHSDVKQVRMTKKARDTAQGLAVSFQQYCEAMDAQAPDKVAVWGGILARRQRECGVELIPHETLEYLVAAANRGTLFRQ
jgi:hypothetical protein